MEVVITSDARGIFSKAVKQIPPRAEAVVVMTIFRSSAFLFRPVFLFPKLRALRASVVNKVFDAPE